MAGNEAVLSVLGAWQLSNPLRPGSPGDPKGPASVGSENIVAAMKEHGLKRLVCQTAWGVGESKEDAGFAGTFFMKVLVPPLLRDNTPTRRPRRRSSERASSSWSSYARCY